MTGMENELVVDGSAASNVDLTGGNWTNMGMDAVENGYTTYAATDASGAVIHIDNNVVVSNT